MRIFINSFLHFLLQAAATLSFTSLSDFLFFEVWTAQSKKPNYSDIQSLNYSRLIRSLLV